MLRIRSAGEEWVAALLDVAVWAWRASSLLPLARVGGMTRSQLRGAATHLLQNSLESKGSYLPQHHAAVLRGPRPLLLPLLVPLPPGALPKSARFSQASMKSSNPTEYSKVFLFSLS